MSHGKEVGHWRTSEPKTVGPHYTDRIAYGTGSEAYPENWDGSMGFHAERSVKEKNAHPDRVPKLGGGVGNVCAAKTLISSRSAAHAKTVAGDKARARDIGA